MFTQLLWLLLGLTVFGLLFLLTAWLDAPSSRGA